MAVNFEMVKYHNKEYPAKINLSYEEIPSHLDITAINPTLDKYSLHTEYSYGKRNLISHLYDLNSELALSQKTNVPELWKSEKWAEEFASFIFKLTAGKNPPSVIEIHPPFVNYTKTMDEFIIRYKVFEEILLGKFPNVQIMIENRCGSIYPGGKFVLSKIKSFIELSKIIDDTNLHLGFALDIPQLFTAHNCQNSNPQKYYELLQQLKPIKHNILGVHLWGKTTSETGRKVSHCGTLDTYFDYNNAIKNEFFEHFIDLFNDNMPRKLVLEVNSCNDDMLSIINDLIEHKVNFI